MPYTGLYGDPNPLTPACSSAQAWIQSYLAIHALSPASYRYVYILWFEFIFLFVVFGLLGRSPSGSTRRSALAARWYKWSIQRPSMWRRWKPDTTKVEPVHPSTPVPPRKLRRPTWWKINFSGLPVNGDLVVFFSLVLCIALASVLGPDYLNPNLGALDLTRLGRRLERHGLVSGDEAAELIKIPTYTIQKAFWTAGNRAGLIAFALFPLCVIVVLKAPPFAVIALRFPAQLHSDQLGWLHRSIGRIVYLLTLAHVTLWSVQLSKDKRVGITDGQAAWVYAFGFPKFIFGIMAFICMTLLIVLSSQSFRRSHFEVFYFFHIILVPLTLIFSALHHPPVSPWCWSTLALWLSERLYRIMRSTWVNGCLLTKMATVSPRSTPTEGGLPVTHQSSSSCTLVPHDSIKRHSNDRGGPYVPSPCYGISTKPPGLPTNDILASIPPGCGRAELLPGRTIRLIVRPVRSISTTAGQYTLLTIPVLSRFTSHPFTIASTHLLDPHAILATPKDIESGVTITSQQSSPGCNQAIEFIIRARQGLTLDLWNHLNAAQTYDKRIGRYNPLILDVRVDGPYGSSARINWKSYGSVLVVVGGSGVAFGLSIVQSLCHAIAEAHTESGVRNLRTNRTDHRGLWSTARLGEFHLKNNRQDSLKTTRIRFVWVVREYSHLMWCASRLRQFAQMVPPDTLDIDIFVTNFAPAITYRPVSAIGDGHSCFIIGDPNQSLTRPKSSSNRSQSAQSQITASDGLERGQNDSSPNLSDPDEKGHQSSIKKHLYDDSTSYRWLGTTPDEDGVDDSYIFMLLTTFDGEEDDSDLESVKLSNAIKNEGLLVQQMASPNIELTHSGHSPPASPQIASDVAVHVHSMLNSVSMSTRPRTVIEPHLYPSLDLRTVILNDDDDMKADETLVADIASPLHSPLDVACSHSAIAGLTPGALSPCSTAQMPQSLPSRPASPILPPKAASLLGGRLATHIHMPGISPSCIMPQCITPGVLSLPPAKHGLFDDLSSCGSLSSTSGSGRSLHHGRRLSTIYSVPDSLHCQTAHARSSRADVYDGSKSIHSLLPAGGAGQTEKKSLDYLFNLPLRERDDMAYIAALARPGHPPLDKILSSEVEGSTGGLVVACCGPSSLDKMVRELVSKQIDPSRVKKGDQRGFITFYSEEFSS